MPEFGHAGDSSSGLRIGSDGDFVLDFANTLAFGALARIMHDPPTATVHLPAIEVRSGSVGRFAVARVGRSRGSPPATYSFEVRSGSVGHFAVAGGIRLGGSPLRAPDLTGICAVSQRCLMHNSG